MTGSSLTAALDAVDEQLAALEIQAPALNFEGLHGALDQVRAAARSSAKKAPVKKAPVKAAGRR